MAPVRLFLSGQPRLLIAVAQLIDLLAMNHRDNRALQVLRHVAVSFSFFELLKDHTLPSQQLLFRFYLYVYSYTVYLYIRMRKIAN